MSTSLLRSAVLTVALLGAAAPAWAAGGSLTTTSDFPAYGGSFQAPQWRSDGQFVYLDGFVKRSGTGALIATLPAEARPGATAILHGNAHDGSVRIDVRSDGTIAWVTNTPTANDYVSLSGLSFPLASTGRTSIELKNGSSVYDAAAFGLPSYIDEGDRVHLSGLVRVSRTAALPLEIGRVPALQANPADRDHVFSVSAHTGISTVEITTDGKIVLQSATERIGWVPLDGIAVQRRVTGVGYTLEDGLLHLHGSTTSANPLTLPDALVDTTHLFNAPRGNGTVRVDVQGDGKVVLVGGGASPGVSGTYSLDGVVLPVPTSTPDELPPPKVSGRTKIGDGWHVFSQIAGGANGSLYALKSDGTLVRYNHDRIAAAAYKGVDALGAEFTDVRKLLGGDDGVLYTVDTAGNFRFHRDLSATSPDGSPAWETSGIIGSGWTFPHVFGGHDGIIYAIASSGELYRYVDKARDGTKDWAPRVTLATGLTDVVSATAGADGKIYLLRAGGRLWRYVDSKSGATQAVGEVIATGWSGVNHLVGAGKLLYSRGTDNRFYFSSIEDGELSVSLDASRLCTPSQDVCIEGSFSATGSLGSLTLKGTATVKTPLAEWRLEAADLTVDVSTDRPYIAGTARVSVPTSGLLSNVVTAHGAALAEVAMGYGGAFDVSIGTGADAYRFGTSPDKFYLYANFEGTAGATFFKGTSVEQSVTFGKGSKLLFEPTTPVFYADNELARRLLDVVYPGASSAVQDPAIGFSLGPCIRYTLKNDLPNPSRVGASKVTTCGNLIAKGKGTIPLKGVDIDLDGGMVLDLDADDDGSFAWQEASDWSVGGDLDVDLGIKLGKKNPFTLTLDALDGSLLYEDKSKRFRLHAHTGTDDFFAGTPLSAFQLGTEQRIVDAIVDDSGSAADLWLQFTTTTMSVAGWQLGSVTTTLTPTMATFRGTLDPVPGYAGDSVIVSGTHDLDTDTVTMTGTSALRVGTSTVSNATVTFRASGLRTTPSATSNVTGTVSYAGVGFLVDGTFSSSGSGSLAGTAGGASGWVTVKDPVVSLVTLGQAKAEGTVTLTVGKTGVTARFSGTITGDPEVGPTQTVSVTNLAVDTSGKIAGSITLFDNTIDLGSLGLDVL